jgi:hypothetical protein
MKPVSLAERLSLMTCTSISKEKAAEQVRFSEELT